VDEAIVQPLIAITTCLDHGRIIRPGHEYTYLKRSYIRAVRQGGGIPLLVSPETPAAELARVADGLVISGGGLLPTRLVTGGAADGSDAADDPERMAWERGLIDAFCALDKPLLGVCYGMQLLNLHFGGTLLHLPAEVGSSNVHHGGAGDTCTHPVRLLGTGSSLAELGERAEVASAHRQAVDQIAPGFSAIATSPDNLTEAIERANVVGVQWHAEVDATGSVVYGNLVRRAARAASG
jgi:putative glutamine amidotransferase